MTDTLDTTSPGSDLELERVTEEHIDNMLVGISATEALDSEAANDRFIAIDEMIQWVRVTLKNEGLEVNMTNIVSNAVILLIHGGMNDVTQAEVEAIYNLNVEI